MSTISPASQAGFCPREWLRYQGNCYGLFHEKLSWHEAEVRYEISKKVVKNMGWITSELHVLPSCLQIRCQSYGRGTHLASILTWSETLIVSKHISAYINEKGVDVWIGLHDIRHVSKILQVSLSITNPPFLTSI